jgi:hypothetical protein
MLSNSGTTPQPPTGGQKFISPPAPGFGGGGVKLVVVPVWHSEANEFVRRLHRHSRPTLPPIFCVGVGDEGGVLRGVAIVGRPVSRHLDDRRTVEILRVCTDGSRNACSMLYRASQRVARELGYARVVTYTLPEEGGASLRGAGFVCDGAAGDCAAGWHRRPGRTVEPVGDDLFGGKLRWSWSRDRAGVT